MSRRAFMAYDIENQVADTEGKTAGKVYDKEVILTNAELKLLTTAKELVAAPGPGKLIEFVSAMLFLDYGSDVLTESGADDNLLIEYDNGTGPAVCATIESGGFIDQDEDQAMLAVATAVAGSDADTMINKNLALLAADEAFGGNASADTTMRIKVTYRIHDFN